MDVWANISQIQDISKLTNLVPNHYEKEKKK